MTSFNVADGIPFDNNNNDNDNDNDNNDNDNDDNNDDVDNNSPGQLSIHRGLYHVPYPWLYT